MKTILKKQGKPEQLAGFEEEVELVLGDVALTVINEPQDLSLLSIILEVLHLFQLGTVQVAQVEEGALVGILQQDVFEEWAAGAEDSLVCFHLLVVHRGQGDIGKVLILPKATDRVLFLSLKARV